MQVWITGSLSTTIRTNGIGQSRLVTVAHGAPHIHISNLRLLGTVRVEEGHLTITDCSIEAIPGAEHRLSEPSSERAIAIVGGCVALLQTALHGHLGGAVEVAAADLKLVGCTTSSSTAPTGGAMLVGHGARVVVELSHFADNSALVSGGALQVRIAWILVAPL